MLDSKVWDYVTTVVLTYHGLGVNMIHSLSPRIADTYLHGLNTDKPRGYLYRYIIHLMYEVYLLLSTTAATLTLTLLPHRRSIIPMLLQIPTELRILLGNSILPNTRQTEDRQRRTEKTQRARHKERVLARPDLIGCIVLDHWEDIRPHERADFTCRCCDPVVLSADGGRAGFGGYEADVIAGAEFAEGKEDSAVY